MHMDIRRIINCTVRARRVEGVLLADCVDREERAERLARRGHRVLEVSTAQQVHKAPPVHKAHLDEAVDRAVILAPKALPERRVPRARKELKVPKGYRAPRVRLEPEARKEHKVPKDLKVPRVPPEPRAHRELRAHKV